MTEQSTDAGARRATAGENGRAAARPPAASLHGRLVGSLPGVQAGAATVAVLRENNSGRVIAQARIAPDGSFAMTDLPQTVRRRSLTLEVAIADQGGASTAISAPVEFPAAGDASVVVDRGAFAADTGSLSPVPEVLDPTRLDEVLKGHEEASAGFAQTRRAARDREPQVDVDWFGASGYLEQAGRPGARSEHYVLAGELTTFDREIVFTRPSPGLREAPARTARLRLTEEERAALDGVVPTICEVTEARGDLRALERRPLLRDRLALQVRIDGLALPDLPPDPEPAEELPPPDGTVEELATAAEAASLHAAANVIADLRPASSELSTATDLRRLHAIAAELELSGGPANVAAAREVNTLQIAFEQPATSLVDKDLVDSWWQLLHVGVDLGALHGITLPTPPERPTRDGLRTYLNRNRRLLSANAGEPVPQLVRSRYPHIGTRIWARLSDEARDVVIRHASPADTTGSPAPMMRAGSTRSAASRGWLHGIWEEITGAIEAAAAIATDTGPTSEIEALLESSPSALAEADQTLEELQSRLSGPYEFTVFVPGTVNYGLLLTYRQEWSPIRYQVGRLVDTIPLTPGERREVRVVTTRKQHENRKTASSQTREANRETTVTGRVESEAINAATMALNNQITSNGNFNIGVGSIGGSTQFTQNLQSESRRTMKNFSEMATKAVDSLKAQLETVVETTTDETTERTVTHTITNPNNEIMLTCLLYELERRYRVATQLQRVRPVVLVALPMPSPDEITPAWILEYSWQIRDALIDETLRETLDDLEDAQSGAAVEFEVRRAALIEQNRIAAQLVSEYESLEAAARRRRSAIVRLTEGVGLAEAGEAPIGERIATGILTGGLSFAMGWGSSDENEEKEAERAAAQQALDYLEKQIEAKGAAMTASAEALARAVDRFTEAAVERRRVTLATTRLQVHIRDNIFHYMHAIWAATHPDQRFFELFDDEVPFHEPDGAGYTLQPAAQPSLVADLPGIDDSAIDFELIVQAPDVTTTPPRRRLLDIADLDRPLGFRGNLVVFELRSCSQLTDHMAAEYLDPVSGVADPGTLSGITTSELVDYIEAAIELGVLTADDLGRLKEMTRQLHRRQPDWTDEFVLPTGQIFLDALKGQTTLLEPFKLVHRGLDVLSAEEDVRGKRIDALRRVRKVAQADLERDPTSVEHFYLGETPHVVPGDGNGPTP